jgi:hypothetical protein
MTTHFYSIPCDSAYEVLMGRVLAVQNGRKKCPCGKDVWVDRGSDGKIIRVFDKCRRSCPGISAPSPQASQTAMAAGMCALCLNRPVWQGHAFCGRTCGQKAKKLGIC